jgi:hypothetical protein
MRMLNMVFETVEIFVTFVARANGAFEWSLKFLFRVTFIVPMVAVQVMILETVRVFISLITTRN